MNERPTSIRNDTIVPSGDRKFELKFNDGLVKPIERSFVANVNCCW